MKVRTSIEFNSAAIDDVVEEFPLINEETFRKMLLCVYSEKIVDDMINGGYITIKMTGYRSFREERELEQKEG